MKTAIITVAGISSRFNKGIPEREKKLKAVFFEENKEDTLLFHLLQSCSFADRIIVVGGYQYEALCDYCNMLANHLKDKVTLVYNEHFEDLASGYSLYLGLKEAFKDDVDEILFVEGDLDIDRVSFEKAVNSPLSVLTYNYEPIYASKAVVLYKDENGRFRYAFNSDHGMLKIDGPFSCILNSGQLWKFTEVDNLKKANEGFYKEEKDGTNLRIIQRYLDLGTETELIGLKRWTNCNTREDYHRIVSYWEGDNK
ncbi:MAG: hypothetical protein E7233_01080 [Lachnospiraceae bacterium]|nr:hypothetical protein [Lachnospiraceae bacterium]